MNAETKILTAEQAYHEIEPRLRAMLAETRDMLNLPVSVSTRNNLHSIRFALESITGDWKTRAK